MHVMMHVVRTWIHVIHLRYITVAQQARGFDAFGNSYSNENRTFRNHVPNFDLNSFTD